MLTFLLILALVALALLVDGGCLVILLACAACLVFHAMGWY